MPEADARILAVALDTSSDLAGVALTENGLLLAEQTWRTRQNHSRELLPALEWLLERAKRTKEDIGAIFICTGPGSYAGLRVGLSTAKALAFGFDVALVGVGRLEADAEPFVSTARGRVVAIQAAGRAELAWAVYEHLKGETHEVTTPRLGQLDVLLKALQPDDLVCADLRTLDEATLDAIRGVAKTVEAPLSRVLAVAAIGRERWLRGAVDNPDTLVPLYLRAPAIGPQN